MRMTSKLAGIAMAVSCALVAGGCEHIDRIFHPEMERAGPARLAAAPARSRRAKRVAKPRKIKAGERLRQFCGQRHIHFQAGRLSEPDAEKARNNDLCKQIYRTGNLPQPVVTVPVPTPAITPAAAPTTAPSLATAPAN